jgi:hypothetical protein
VLGREMGNTVFAIFGKHTLLHRLSDSLRSESPGFTENFWENYVMGYIPQDPRRAGSTGRISGEPLTAC